MAQTIKQAIDKYSDFLGNFCAILLVLLLFNVFFNVVMRYVFNSVSIGMQEMEWHLYSTIFLLGVAYAIKTNGHVRVDIFYEKLSDEKKALIDSVGVIVFVLPFASLVFYYGIDFAYQAFDIMEQSGDPGGLPYRWVIKSMISIAFGSIILSSVATLIQSITVLTKQSKD